MIDRPGVLLGALNLALGAVLLLGGDLRTSSPSFRMVLEVATPDQWGVLFILGGLVCLLAASLGRIGAVLVGAGAGVHIFWALGLIQAAEADPRAALTGCVVYSWITAVHIYTAFRLARRVT